VIQSGGYDVAESHLGGGDRVDLVLTAQEAERLRARGVDVSLKRNGRGQTVREQADAMAAAGYQVYRSYDEAGGIRDELYALAKRYPAIVKLEVIGRTLQGREIIALKVTKNAGQLADGARPATLYMGTIHAREWIATEVSRRLLRHFVENYGRNAEITNLLNTRELWFMPVANPDGYQYTFSTERLWRKNLRDNNGDGTITNGDGVDLNRNYDERWNYDNEGSSTESASDTYRGAAPASEPEVKAHQALIDRMKFKFLVTYHSYGPLLLYAYGWQVKTPSFDDPLFIEYTGTDANPAVQGYDPGVGADLYTTNGTTDDYSYSKAGALSWTPELSEGCDGCGFVFPDDEALVQAEFEKNLPFAMRLARSTPDPANPVGAAMKPFYLETASLDPEKSGNPLGNFRFGISYGDPQPVQVIAKRSLGAVAVKYRINGGPVRTATTAEASGGERFGPGGDVYYHLVRGTVTGTSVGDKVEVWFEDADNAAAKSESFTYTAVAESGRRVLVVAAEDYSGISPVYKKGPLSISPTTSTRSPRAAMRPTSTTSTRMAARRPARSACSATMTRSSGTRATTSSRATRGWRPGRRRASRTTRCSSCASTSTREAAFSSRASTRACSTPTGTSSTSSAGSRATPPRRPTAARRCRTTSCSTTSARTSTTTTPARRRTAASTTSSASPTHSAASRGRSAARAPTTRTTARRSSPPAASCPRRPTHSSRAGPPRSTSGRAGHSIPTRAPTTRTRRSRTSPTSG
jgi:hypothetical protein